MSLAVQGPVVEDLAFAVGSTGDDGDGSCFSQRSAQGVGVVALVGQDVASPGRAGEQGRGDGDVRDVAGREDQGKGAAGDVGEGVDLARLAAARRADTLDFGPPFPPKAERCALT